MRNRDQDRNERSTTDDQQERTRRASRGAEGGDGASDAMTDGGSETQDQSRGGSADELDRSIRDREQEGHGEVF